MATPATATATRPAHRPDELAAHHIEALHAQLAAYLHANAPAQVPARVPERSGAEQLVDQVGPAAVDAAHTRHTAALQARLVEQTEQLHRLAGGTGQATASGLLATAHHELVRRGWTRGHLQDPNGRVCLLGSLDATGTPKRHPARLVAERHLLAVIREMHPGSDTGIASSNDHLLADGAEAAAVLDRAHQLALAAGD